MSLSYWEKQTWFTDVDFCIVGSGIVGLSCALQLKKDYPNAKILILERGFLPHGASTKNAGFACYGSMSEILSDLKSHTEDEVFELVKSRNEGLQQLRKILGDKNLGYQQNGGYEVFLDEDYDSFENCISNIKYINELLKPVFGSFAFKEMPDKFNFSKCINQLIFNPFEGQIDTGKMMFNFIRKVQTKHIPILNGIEVINFTTHSSYVEIELKDFSFRSNHVFIATNAFAGQFLEIDLKPARNQVIITKPIKNLNLKGVFHLNQGYYYFRNINNRILLGGGRHLDFQGETTSSFGTTKKIINHLKSLLEGVVMKGVEYEIENSWSGILGVGKQKKPIIKSLNNRMHCGVRLGGMGVAIGTNTGQKLAKLV